MAIASLDDAREAIEHFPDDKNLSLWRDVATLEQGVLEGSILSAAQKYEELQLSDRRTRYSAGWWDRIARLGESVGGQETPCLTDLAENIGARYLYRMGCDLFFGFVFFSMAAVATPKGRRKRRKRRPSKQQPPQG